MGTNYHVRWNECLNCGRPGTERHIGKSSIGWAFALHVYPEDDISNLEDWKRVFEAVDKGFVTIKDEYGTTHQVWKMLDVITNRPNYARRHDVDKWFCIGHGEGSYDYCIGEYS